MADNFVKAAGVALLDGRDLLNRIIGPCWALTLWLTAAAASAQNAPEAKDMTLVGYNDLQARSAYQPEIHQQFGRWIAYIGHHGGTDAVPKPLNPLTGAQGGERHFHPRCDRPASSEISRAYPW